MEKCNNIKCGDCPVCQGQLDMTEIHLGIVTCPGCESGGRCFDIDSGDEGKTIEILKRLNR